MGHHCCNKQKVKRGLWSPEEDERLFKYITTHGHASWSSLPKLAGLQRCGKSCRLRWINYLRPDLKRGSFSAQEERIIIDVHRILGNRWAQIARHLPGRTDNEVKNFWNSCIKKKLLAQGLDPNTHNLLPNNITDGSSATNIYNGTSTSCKHSAGTSCCINTDQQGPTITVSSSAALGNNDCYSLVDMKPPFLITTPAAASSVPVPPPPPFPPLEDDYCSQSFSSLHEAGIVSSIPPCDQSLVEDQNYCNMVGTIGDINPTASKESSQKSVLPYSSTSSYNPSAGSLRGHGDYCVWESLDDIGIEPTLTENEALLILQSTGAAYAATSGNMEY